MPTFCSKQSPRFDCECQALHFYEGDTFRLEYQIELTKTELDGNGNETEVPVEIGLEDVVTFEVRKGNRVFATKEFTGIEDNTVVFEWDEEWTKKFKSGNDFTYRIRLNSEFVRTIVADPKIVVE